MPESQYTFVASAENQSCLRLVRYTLARCRCIQLPFPRVLMKTQEKLLYLQDRWDDRVAGALDAPELLRYRSNLLGSDLRITNFGGGNTSSKILDSDPLDGAEKKVLWIKGSGGDIGSIQRNGFATLSLHKVHSLAGRYRGVEFEDEMVAM